MDIKEEKTYWERITTYWESLGDTRYYIIAIATFLALILIGVLISIRNSRRLALEASRKQMQELQQRQMEEAQNASGSYGATLFAVYVMVGYMAIKLITTNVYTSDNSHLTPSGILAAQAETTKQLPNTKAVKDITSALQDKLVKDTAITTNEWFKDDANVAQMIANLYQIPYVKGETSQQVVAEIAEMAAVKNSAFTARNGLMTAYINAYDKEDKFLAGTTPAATSGDSPVPNKVTKDDDMYMLQNSISNPNSWDPKGPWQTGNFDVGDTKADFDSKLSTNRAILSDITTVLNEKDLSKAFEDQYDIVKHTPNLNLYNYDIIGDIKDKNIALTETKDLFAYPTNISAIWHDFVAIVFLPSTLIYEITYWISEKWMGETTSLPLDQHHHHHSGSEKDSDSKHKDTK